MVDFAVLAIVPLTVCFPGASAHLPSLSAATAPLALATGGGVGRSCGEMALVSSVLGEGLLLGLGPSLSLLEVHPLSISRQVTPATRSLAGATYGFIEHPSVTSRRETGCRCPDYIRASFGGAEQSHEPAELQRQPAEPDEPKVRPTRIVRRVAHFATKGLRESGDRQLEARVVELVETAEGPGGRPRAFAWCTSRTSLPPS